MCGGGAGERAHVFVFFPSHLFPCKRPVGWDGPPTSYWRGSPAFAILAGGEREAAGARWQLPARVSQQVGEVRRGARERASCGRQFQEAGRQGPLHRDRHDGCPAGGPARTRRRSNPRRGFCRALARSRASARISWRASGPHLPPTSTATTTSLHQRAAVNSGYRRRLRSSACWAARPGSVRVPG